MVGYQTLNFEAQNLMSPLQGLIDSSINLTCQVPGSFDDVQDDKGQYVAPYYQIMPFEIQQLDDKQLKFKTQMFYFDPSANAIKLLFIKGTQIIRVEADKLKEFLLHIDLPQ
jgi:hypothetical protein